MAKTLVQEIEELKKQLSSKEEEINSSKKIAIIRSSSKDFISKTDVKKAISELRNPYPKDIFIWDNLETLNGVNPKKWGKTEASMLLPPLQFRANAVSSWIAWGGGTSTLTFLCSDWVYRNTINADVGLTNYNGITRASLAQNSVAFNTVLSQIDTVNQAGLMAKSFSLLPKVQFESLFN